LARHGKTEASLACDRYKQNKSRPASAQTDVNTTTLVFPLDLFTHCVEGSLGSRMKAAPEELAVVFVTAILEYLAAEIIELAGNTAMHFVKDNITSQIVRHGISTDPALRELLREYSVPCSSPEEQTACQSWLHRSKDLVQLLSQLPSEEVSSAVKSIEENLHVLDAKVACRDILQAFSEEVEEQEVSNEIRRLSNVITIQSSTLHQFTLAATRNPRVKIVEFSVKAADAAQEAICFRYTSEMVDVATGLPWVKMSATAPASFAGQLWGNESYGAEYTMNMELLNMVKTRVGTTLTDELFVRVLVSVGEAEPGGGIGNIEAEMDAILHDVFGSPDGEEPSKELTL